MRQIKLGMVGGGQGAFIGSVHRIAARLDDHYKLIAGVLNSTPESSKTSASDHIHLIMKWLKKNLHAKMELKLYQL